MSLAPLNKNNSIQGSNVSVAKVELKHAQNRMNEIFEIISSVTNPSESDLGNLLQRATKLIKMDVGIISQIEGDTYKILDFYSTSDSQLTKNQEFKLGNTYCAITYTQNNIIDISDMSSSKYNGHPCYANFKLESYIGVPIFVDGFRYGTLNFSSTEKREIVFNQLDRDFVLYLGQWVGNLISRIDNENYINEKNRELKQMVDDHQAMSYTLLHDLKSPINRLQYILGIAKGEYGDPSEFEVIEMMEEAVGDANALIQDLEEVTLIEEKVLKVNKKLIHCDDFLADMIGKFRSAAEVKHITLHTDLIDAAYIHSDYNLLFRVISNLLSNALKFSENGKKVTFSIRRIGDDVVFDIQDQGPGISAEDQTKMFMKFQKLTAAPTNSESSTGLGLYIVKQLLELLGARIEVESKLGKGSSFKVIHPIDS